MGFDVMAAERLAAEASEAMKEAGQGFKGFIKGLGL